MTLAKQGALQRPEVKARLAAMLEQLRRSGSGATTAIIAAAEALANRCLPSWNIWTTRQRWMPFLEIWLR